MDLSATAEGAHMSATVSDVAALVDRLPQVTEGERHGHRTWSVAGKAFAWERPFSKADLRRFGEETPPDGPILAVRVADLGEKEAVLAAHPGPLFTIPHFEGFSAVLVHLRTVPKKLLREVIVAAWLACAPPGVAETSLARVDRVVRDARPGDVVEICRFGEEHVRPHYAPLIGAA